MARAAVVLTFVAVLTGCGADHPPAVIVGPAPPAPEPPTTTTSTTEAPVIATTTSVPVRPTTTVPAPPRTTVVEPVDDGGTLACLRRYESEDGAGSSNAYQFTGSTWSAAFSAAKDQGLIPIETASTSAGYAERWVQDAAAQAWINLGYLRSAWAAQAGRCF